MKPLLTGELISRIDRAIEKYLIISVILIVASSLASAILITILRSKEYLRYESCFSSPECYAFFGKIISPQIEVIKAGAATATLVILITGGYLAIRTYLTSSKIGMLGNAISHISFFERFIASEISRRKRLSPNNIDTFALYEVMFPRGNANQRFASPGFTKAVNNFFSVIEESSRRYSSRKNEFKFDDHRRRVIDILASLHISMHYNPRIDFLETEDEVLDFLLIVCRVFSQPEYTIDPPVRRYR